MKKELRRAVIAGNWKMNNTPSQAKALIEEMKPLVADANCDVVLCVPFIDIPAAVEAAKGSNIKIGAENVHFKASGAYTGEISADMLKEAGVEYVVIGHSERRQYFGETDQTVNLRSLAALNAGLKAIICVDDDYVIEQTETAIAKSPSVEIKIIVGREREGWKNFNEEYTMFSSHFDRTDSSPCGNDPMLMYFTSGTSGYPKSALHNYKYPLGHFHTAKYWHCVNPDGLHLTISDTGWAKAMWGKLYGQWLCEAAVFVYDFDRFDAAKILPLFRKHKITTFCAPPTMYRMIIKEDLSKYDLSSIEHATIAGEALNPEVFRQFEKQTGLKIMEGFGQSETTLVIGNLVGKSHKIGSMGKPVPTYKVDLVDADGNSVPDGDPGEIVIHTENGAPCGLFCGYYNDEEKTNEAWHDGMYHTGDLAWRDEDGFFWYVGRVDDVIKSSGYRIGPFEIESVIMELPYVLECGVSAAPDEIRGQIVKASIVLTKSTQPTDELKREIQNYVKKRTAPYKYPRLVEFKNELPKTTSGKIIRNKL